MLELRGLVFKNWFACILCYLNVLWLNVVQVTKHYMLLNLVGSKMCWLYFYSVASECSTRGRYGGKMCRRGARSIDTLERKCSDWNQLQF